MQRDGSMRAASFPELVSPDTIASDIRLLRYQPSPGLQVEVEFDGELFETDTMNQVWPVQKTLGNQYWWNLDPK